MKKYVALLSLSTMLFAVPNAPSNIALKALSTSSIAISWQDNSSDERGFKIFRDGNLIDIVNQNTQNYIDKGLQPNTNYKYEIKSSDDFGFKLNGNISDVAHMHLFIDSDHNRDTGYSNNGIIGADILLQNGIVFQKDGNTQTSWRWKRVGVSQSQINGDNTIFITFDESELGGVDIDKDSTFQAFNFSDDFSSKTGVRISSKLAIDPDTSILKQVHFTESLHALKNPLKGFMLWPSDTKSSLKYVSLLKGIVHWSDIEERSSDGVDKIRQYSNNELFNNRWDKYIEKNYQVQDKNIKVNPIVTLDFNTKPNYQVGDAFPLDMQISDHDNQTDLFVQRIDLLVKKMAEAWDDDPRIGFVYMGITGKWGEQFYKIGERTPLVMTPSVIKVLGDSFSKYFKNKKILVRNPKYFDGTSLQANNNTYRGYTYPNHYKFGVFWDAFAWSHEMNDGLLDMDKVIKDAKMWEEQPILGEVAFNTNYIHIYDSADYTVGSEVDKNKHAIHDTLVHEDSLDYLNDYIRSVHCSALTWIAKYNEYDEGEANGAEIMQKTMGYRFVLTDASYTESINDTEKLEVSFGVKNVGSAPFYYDWPVEVALLDKDSKEVVWSDRIQNVDIRDWKSGDDWDFDNNRYKEEAKTYRVSGSFDIPKELKNGEYILSVSILDPASMKPSVKFAVTNYYNGGRTALGIVGIGVNPSGSLPAFDDLQSDGLSY